MTEDIIITEALFGLIGKKKENNYSGFSISILDPDYFAEWKTDSKPVKIIGGMIRDNLGGSSHKKFLEQIELMETVDKNPDNAVRAGEFIYGIEVEVCKIIDKLISKLTRRSIDDIEDTYQTFVDRIAKVDENLGNDIQNRFEHITDDDDFDGMRSVVRIFDEYYERIANVIRGGK